MNELGFFMDQKGNITYYGKWTPKIDYNDPEQFHESSFKMDVESKEYFKSLNLEYDMDISVHVKVKYFAVQGMVSMLNLSMGHNKDCMHLHVPVNLTEEQKDKFTELYGLFSSFDNVTIYIYASKNVEDRRELKNVDEYFDLFSIKRTEENNEENIKKL